MPTTYRPYMPEQGLLLPESLSEWLPEEHLAYFVSDAVDALDLDAFHARYEGDGRRRQPFDPRMMVKVLIYGYASGVFSSRKIARKLHEDVAFRVLCANNYPAPRTIREFRQLHLKEFSELFVQVVKLAREAGLVSLGRVGIDGTKIKANASKHKAMSYGRMQEEEARLKREIAGLLKQAEAQDQADEKRYGPDDSNGGLPEELRRRCDRLKVIEAAKARLEERERQADKADARWVDGNGVTRAMSGRPCRLHAYGVPPPSKQDNFTDPDSRIMATSSGGFEQCYNAQVAVDEGSQLIVAADLTNQVSECAQLLPMVDQIECNTASRPEMVLADTGYASEAGFQGLESRAVAACVALGGEDKQRAVKSHLSATLRMLERLRTPEGRAHYRRRKTIPEPVFGWIKQVIGFRCFSLRGIAAVSAEWRLMCTAMNLKRLHRLGWMPG
jgi:transposase